jgi:hypothetical protein
MRRSLPYHHGVEATHRGRRNRCPTMKHYFLCAILMLLAATGILTGCAGANSTLTRAAAQPNLDGEFLGEWRGQDQSSGAVTLKFAPGKDSAWTASVVFTYETVKSPTTTKSVRIDGNRVEVEFAWEVEGTAAATKLVGELKGDQIEGSYASTTAEGAAAGKWKAARIPTRS